MINSTISLVLIVAECNVNPILHVPMCQIGNVLIVAECNVNANLNDMYFKLVIVLIVAECNVNMGILEGIVISTSRFNSSRV